MRTTSLCMLVAFLLAGQALFGQTANDEQTDTQTAGPSESDTWRILLVQGSGPEAIDAVQQHIDAGFVPVGIEISAEEGMRVMVARLPRVEIRRWAIIDYQDWNLLEDEITTSIEEGFVPMGLSRYGDSLAVIWVETADIDVSGWRITTSADSEADISSTIQRFKDQEFSVWGASKHEGLRWYLFLAQSTMVPGGALATYSSNSDEVASGIRAAAFLNMVPLGIASDSSSVDICFARPKLTTE